MSASSVSPESVPGNLEGGLSPEQIQAINNIGSLAVAFQGILPKELLLVAGTLPDKNIAELGKLACEYPDETEVAVENAKEAFDQAEPLIDPVIAFLKGENPKKIFVGNIDLFAETVVETTRSKYEARRTPDLHDKKQTQEVPKGKFGIAMNIVRRVRTVWKSIKNVFAGADRNSTDNALQIEDTGPSAQDFGYALFEKMQEMADNPFEAVGKYNVLGLLAFTPVLKNILNLPLAPNFIALFAPEVLAMLTTITENESVRTLAETVNKNPHELNIFKTILRHVPISYRGVTMRKIQELSRTLLPNIRDALPTSGVQVRYMYDQIQHFLDHDFQPKKHDSKARTEPAEPTPKPLEFSITITTERILDTLKTVLGSVGLKEGKSITITTFHINQLWDMILGLVGAKPQKQ